MPCKCGNLSCSCESSSTQSSKTTISTEVPPILCPYSYDSVSNLGPFYWHKYFSQCNGCKQSPIAISIYNTTKINGQLKFDNLNKRPSFCVIKNTGHTVMVSFCWLINDAVPPSITGGPLNNVLYYFHHLVMHWGGCNSEGSEHTLNGKRYPLEIQLFFYNSTYENYEIARENPNGLVILSFLCGIENNAPKFPITDYLRFLCFPDNRICLDEDYCGSTTMPPCSENVQWILSNCIIPISEDLLLKLRKLRNNHFQKIMKNYRPLQDIHDRKIYFYIR